MSKSKFLQTSPQLTEQELIASLKDKVAELSSTNQRLLEGIETAENQADLFKAQADFWKMVGFIQANANSMERLSSLQAVYQYDRANFLAAVRFGEMRTLYEAPKQVLFDFTGKTDRAALKEVFTYHFPSLVVNLERVPKSKGRFIVHLENKEGNKLLTERIVVKRKEEEFVFTRNANGKPTQIDTSDLSFVWIKLYKLYNQSV